LACTTPAAVALLAALLNYLLLLTQQSAEHGAVKTQWKELFSFRDHQSQPVHHPNWTGPKAGPCSQPKLVFVFFFVHVGIVPEGNLMVIFVCDWRCKFLLMFWFMIEKKFW
jgi:hypothetical protein